MNIPMWPFELKTTPINKEDPYTELTEDAKYWLPVVWPTLDDEIRQMFIELWDELTDPLGRSDKFSIFIFIGRPNIFA